MVVRVTEHLLYLDVMVAGAGSFGTAAAVYAIHAWYPGPLVFVVINLSLVAPYLVGSTIVLSRIRPGLGLTLQRLGIWYAVIARCY